MGSDFPPAILRVPSRVQVESQSHIVKYQIQLAHISGIEIYRGREQGD